MLDLSLSSLHALVVGLVGQRRAERLFAILEIPEPLVRPLSAKVSRAELAMAMNVLLLEENLRRVPYAALYVEDERRSGRRLTFDHGALRTVAAPSGALPSGCTAFARFLEPLGYFVNGTYPLDRLGMTGRAYAHRDFPEGIPQFFVSELHPDRFSPAFQEAVGRVLADSKDPLSDSCQPHLRSLAELGELPFPAAQELLPELVSAFDRQHGIPALRDYEILRAESVEMAWIATEGNAFNHATDRVPDVAELTLRQQALGRPMKDEVEVSSSGRIIQTAYRAAEVERPFVDEGGRLVLRRVPGSFFEFITRKCEADGRLDLRFDASNAQAIFKMTAAETH